MRHFRGRLESPTPRLPTLCWPCADWLVQMSHSLPHRLCRLATAEYNVLVHNNELYCIDVSQAVELDHPRAFDFLREGVPHLVLLPRLLLPPLVARMSRRTSFRIQCSAWRAWRALHVLPSSFFSPCSRRLPGRRGGCAAAHVAGVVLPPPHAPTLVLPPPLPPTPCPPAFRLPARERLLPAGGGCHADCAGAV